MFKALVFSAAVLFSADSAAGDATVLTNDNFADEITNKAAFVKFYAPWCGHCKKMAPDWKKLADGFENNDGVVIGDVDCTIEKELCSKYGVQGFPTLKYFVGSDDGEKYEGGRDFDSLKTFADENLGPSCGPDNRDLCKEEQLALLDEATALSAEDRKAAIEKKVADIEAAEELFKNELEKLQSRYTELTEEKDATIASISPSLRLYRSIKAAAAAKDEL